MKIFDCQFSYVFFVVCSSIESGLLSIVDFSAFECPEREHLKCNEIRVS